jgi:hypothetical protein
MIFLIFGILELICSGVSIAFIFIFIYKAQSFLLTLPFIVVALSSLPSFFLFFNLYRMKENMETNTKNISKLLKSLNVCRQELNLPPYKQCSNCSHIIKNETTECPNCGYKLK